MYLRRKWNPEKYKDVEFALNTPLTGLIKRRFEKSLIVRCVVKKSRDISKLNPFFFLVASTTKPMWLSPTLPLP